MRELKVINYRQGALRFSIPVEWSEEYGRDSGGTFFEQAPDSGTLRLSVVVLNTKGKTDADALERFLKTRPEARAKGAQISKESNGNVVLQFIQRTNEGGDDMSIVWWFVASGAFEDYIQIAMFSYSLLNLNLNKEQNKEDILLLDQVLRKTEFVKMPQISGSHS